MILTKSTLKKTIKKLREEGKVIVLATGFFDLIHPAHISFLKAAKSSGDVLIVAVESDERARLKKGPSRPVLTQEDRLTVLDAIKYIDYVFPLPVEFSSASDHKSFIELARPHILAVSSSSPNLKQKQNILTDLGVELKVVHPHIDNLSTSDIISKIKSSN